MSALLSEKTDKVRSVRAASWSPAQLLLGVSAFLTGFLPCLMHNLFFCESRIMLASDGKHFLTTVALLVEYLRQYASTPLAGKFLSESQLAGHIMFDGPLMSLIYAPVFLLLNKIPTPRDWLTLAAGQSVFHGLSTLILALLTLRLTGSRLFAVMAALLFGLYPPAVLQSGHFMSELPATTVLLALLFALSTKKKPFVSWLLAGFCASVLILSKPALIPCVGLASLMALARVRRPMNADQEPVPAERQSAGLKRSFAWLINTRSQISGLALGLALIVIPWAVFSFNSSGSFMPTAQRQPLYNVVTGWNTEADGWAYNPHTPMTDLFCEADGPLPAAMGIWMSHPQESMRLALSKLSRLSSCPWNDFKGRALGLDENAQILLHRLIIALSAFGAAMYAFCSRRYLNNSQRSLLEISFAVIVAHISYLMVECQPRYGFTAMPFAVLLAIYGIWQVSRLSFHDPIRRLVIVSSVAFALSSTAFLLHAENVCRFMDGKALKERSHTLSMHDRVEKEIDLSASAVPEHIKSVVLLVDGDSNLDKCRLELNGVALRGRLISTMHFDPAHYALYDQLREFGPAMRISVDDFRQWRAIPIKAPLINWHGKNQIVLTSLAKSATVYGDRKITRFTLSPDYCNYGVLAASPVAAGAESRFIDPVLAASSKQASFITTKINAANDAPGEISREPLKDSLRMKLLVSLADSPAADQAGTAHNAPDSDPNLINVSRQSFDKMLWDSSSDDCLRINKVILYAARTVAADIPLPRLDSKSHIRIRVKGELKALKNAGDVGLLCALKGKNGQVQILGKTPRALCAASNWHKFQIDDLVPLGALGGRAESLQLALYPCPWMEGQYGVSRRASDAIFRKITIEVSPDELPALSGRHIIY